MSSTVTTAVNAVRMTAPKGVFFRQFLVLARQKKPWPPSRLARLMWGAIANIAAHRKILRFLKLPAYAETAQNDPRFALRYLTLDYLVRDFTVAKRTACFVHHYRRLHALLPNRLLRQILQGDVTLHEIPEDGHRFAITMGLSKPTDNEGEMSLNLLVDGEIVFVLSFTIVPGWVVKSKAEEILLITRIQGKKGSYRQIYLATKALYEVAPAPLLLAALQGVANAFGISEMASVCAAMQRAADTEEHAVLLETAYDAFFLELGMAKNPAGFFLSPIPLEDKPLSNIKPGHKLRTKAKRAFKQQVSLACAGFFE